jgi:hypothetical protein
VPVHLLRPALPHPPTPPLLSLRLLPHTLLLPWLLRRPTLLLPLPPRAFLDSSRLVLPLRLLLPHRLLPSLLHLRLPSPRLLPSLLLRLSLPAPLPAQTALLAPTTVLSSALAATPSVFATVAALLLRSSRPAWLALTARSSPQPSDPSPVRTSTSATVLAFASSKRNASHRVMVGSFLQYLSL